MTDQLAATGWAYTDIEGDTLQVDSCSGRAVDFCINGQYVEVPAGAAIELAQLILRNLRDGDLRPVRGILWALAFSLPIWAVLAFVAWWWWR